MTDATAYRPAVLEAHTRESRIMRTARWIDLRWRKLLWQDMFVRCPHCGEATSVRRWQTNLQVWHRECYREDAR